MIKRGKFFVMLSLALAAAGFFAGGAGAASECLDLTTVLSYAQENSPVLKV
ncbi:MAG: hypothetical protein GXO34_00810, partial [Deltaproteobacteria bacterium]|nr:hypothetical protein [Deltaproteobacteria bacterium]